jgi:hypothetical protein
MVFLGRSSNRVIMGTLSDLKVSIVFPTSVHDELVQIFTHAV